MPRGVTKTKDGVEKKGKGKGDVKRSRKMRGGGETFKEYCEEFVKGNKDEYTRAKKFVKDMFNNLYYAINKIDIEIDRWGKNRNVFTPNPYRAAKKEALQIILKILKKTNDDDEENEEEANAVSNAAVQTFTSVIPSASADVNETMQEKDPVKGIQGIQGIDNKDLKNLLVYINLNIKKIITSYKELKEKGNEPNIKGLEQFQNSIIIDTTKLTKLFQNILFLKIYKLFEEFADISSAVTIISDIKIKKKEDDIPRDREALIRQSSIKSSGSEITLNLPKEQLNPNGVLNADNVVGNWFEPQTIQDRKNEQRITSTKGSKIFTKKTLQPNRASVIQQKGDLLQGDASQVNVLSSSEVEVSDVEVSDDESEDDFDIVGDAKSALMVLINDNTNDAADASIYKGLEEIKNNLNDDDEFEKYIKKVLNDLLFQKIKDILILLDRSNHAKKEIEDFLLRVEDDKISEEIEGYKKHINRNFSTIDTIKKNSKKELIVNAKDELIKLFSIFSPKIKKYIQLFDTQTEPDDTNGSNISQESPVLLGIRNPLNSPPNPLSALPPLKGADSSFLSKLVINGSNQTKLDVAKNLKERYEKDMLEINIILKEKDTYLDQQNIKQRVIVLFKNIIIMAFKILNFKKITEMKNDLLILENYTTTFSNLIFLDMNSHVLQYYINPATEYIVIKKTTDKINLLKKLFDNFNMFFSGELNMLSRNNNLNKIWEAEGGQPQKPPTAKEPKNNKPKEPTKTPKAKEPTKTPKAKEPTKTPKPKEPTKTPKPKEPTKTPKPKEATKTPKPKEPTKTPKPKEPTKTANPKELTKTPKPKEPKNNKPKEPKNNKANKPTKTPKAMKLAKEPNAKKPTKTPKPKEPTKTPKPKEPTKTPKPKEPKNNKPKEPTKNNKPKEATKK